MSRLRSSALTLALVATLAACDGTATPDLVDSAVEPRVEQPREPRAGASSDDDNGRATQPRRPRTPREAATLLTRADRVIADPDSSGRQLARAGHQQQLVFREAAVRRGWDDRFLRALGPQLRRAAQANLDSRREFRSMHYRLSDTLPAWRIVKPAPADELLSHYRAAERRFGVDWEYLAAINLIETGMGRIRGTSVAGARGPMQFIAPTWAQYGRGDINDPRDAIFAAARYLSARGFTDRGGIPGALYSYNNHNAYVRGVTDIAQDMQRRPRAFYGYYHWQIYYLSSEGDVLLPVGYERTEPIGVRRYLARNPQG